MTRRFVFICFVSLFAPAASSSAQTATERSWNLLQQALTDAKAERRAVAAHALGLLEGDQRAETLAGTAIADSHSEVRAAAATALGQIGRASSAPRLKEALKDPESEVVFSAAGALYALKDPGAYSVYYAVLTGERKTGEPLLESQLEMLKDPKALGKIGFEAGMGLIPFGGVGYKAIRTIRADKVSPVRAAAAQKLATDPDPKSAQALADATSDEEWIVRASAVSAIARRGDSKLLSAVIPLLEDPHDTVRFNAAAAVIRLSAKQ